MCTHHSTRYYTSYVCMRMHCIGIQCGYMGSSHIQYSCTQCYVYPYTVCTTYCYCYTRVAYQHSIEYTNTSIGSMCVSVIPPYVHIMYLWIRHHVYILRIMLSLIQTYVYVWYPVQHTVYRTPLVVCILPYHVLVVYVVL